LRTDRFNLSINININSINIVGLCLEDILKLYLLLVDEIRDFC
jgi:hypothetical protein